MAFAWAIIETNYYLGFDTYVSHQPDWDKRGRDKVF